jgi:squalene-hopene/tetraprenyl-beta-curcumene cyclase
VTSDAKDQGGFVYAPGVSKAGESKSAGGKISLRSYGSMSYAGLLSYIYADVKRDDPRVNAVVGWLRNHYTLDENPGMGADGLYYYYFMMSKALFAYGAPELEMSDGHRVDWRKDLALKLINLQKPDGSWSNESGRWMEKDPTLVTCYAVLALEYIYHSF